MLDDLRGEVAQAPPQTRNTHGLLAIWHGVEAGFEDFLDAWYDRQHHFERAGVPGFSRARRYLNLDAGPRYLSRYDVDEPSVLASDAYLQALNNPTEWTRASMLHYRDTTRGVFRFVTGAGAAEGGALVSLRLPDAPAQALDRIGPEVLQAVVNCPGVLRVEIWRSDNAVSGLRSEEKKLRGKADSAASHAVFVEGTHIDVVSKAVTARLLPLIDGDVVMGRYQLAFQVQN